MGMGGFLLPQLLMRSATKSGGKNVWYQGQKVRCINGRFPVQVLDWGSNLPCEGKVYTIRRIARVPNATTGHIGPGFLLEELKNPDDRLHFDSNRFVPIRFPSSFHAVAAAHELQRRRHARPLKVLPLVERRRTACETIHVTFYRSDRGYSRPVEDATDQAANRRRVPPAARRKLCRERAGAPLLSAAPLWPA